MRLRIYLDTSVISAYYDDRFPERQRETAAFWSQLGQFDVSVSSLTEIEIQNTHEVTRRNQMVTGIQPFTIIPIDAATEQLAQLYVDQGIFSSGSLNDALHVAAAVVSRQDIVVSWNFRHLVNRRRRALINDVNIVNGYPTIEIVAPPEL